MTDNFPLMIPGASADGMLEVKAPYDQSHIATVEVAGPAAVEQALSTAYALFRDRDAWLPAPQRIAILERLTELMREQAEELAVEAAREGGKPLVDSRIEVGRAIDGVRNCIDCIRDNHGEEIPMGINPASLNHMAMTHREPVGVVVAISAFNHPLNLIVHQVGPAIAAGCPVVVKPAEDTPLSCLRFVGLLREAGLPAEWCQAAVIGEREVATSLVTDKRVGFFSFIGSGKVGWWLRSQLAPGTRCALEHGGSAPVIVEPDADLSEALPMLAKAGFYHAGQVCVSVQRVYVHRSIARRVAEGLAELGNNMHIGDPTSADTDVGPLIRPAEVERVHEWVEDAIRHGAEKLSGGHKVGDTCYATTVLLDPADDSTISRHEVFGPVILVYSYDEMDDALDRANALPVAFQAAIYTKNLDTAMRAYRRFDASAVMVNDHTAFRVDWMPFAGLRESGHGVGGIPYTFRDMQIEKLLVIHSAEL
ncbi:aldehyde dehydrogenase family protein [Sulfuriflexus sp.]|uniref:aldehyde dehydrogenase family protein n=1 Tax=Sulfuriflexus sp. TaxID=2015443 RepID=UPI0028CE6FFC|nr:aldehyde dehydrogenase family protein [Sulfuriflexus sp.]MDT8403846.1 aldehyde dehydrogenase family protein [Sulfuriflexus sp.]